MVIPYFTQTVKALVDKAFVDKALINKAL